MKLNYSISEIASAKLMFYHNLPTFLAVMCRACSELGRDYLHREPGREEICSVLYQVNVLANEYSGTSE